MVITPKRIIYGAFALTLCIANISQAMQYSKRKNSSSSSESSDDNAWAMKYPTSGMLLKHDIQTKQELSDELRKTQKELALTKLALLGAEKLHSRIFDTADANYENVCRMIGSLKNENIQLQEQNAINTQHHDYEEEQAARIEFLEEELYVADSKIQELQEAQEKWKGLFTHGKKILETKQRQVDALTKINHTLLTYNQVLQQERDHLKGTTQERDEESLHTLAMLAHHTRTSASITTYHSFPCNQRSEE